MIKGVIEMQRLARLLAMMVIVALLIAAGFLASWDLPSPIARVEKVIPHERFLDKPL